MIVTDESSNPSYSPVLIENTPSPSLNSSSSSHNPIPSSQNSFNWTAGTIVLSIFLFILAGIFEIGGGYLVWIGIRNKNRPYLFIPIGSIILIAYGIIPTFQPVDSFGRVYAVYGGFFIVLSYVWAYVFDSFKPDIGDYVGTSIAIAGVCLAWFWPR